MGGRETGVEAIWAPPDFWGPHPQITRDIGTPEGDHIARALVTPQRFRDPLE